MSIDIKKIYSLFSLLLIPFQTINATDSIYFTMNGSIVDTACAINTGSYEQSINMGNFPIYLLRNQQKVQPQNISITLIGCQLTSHTGQPWNKFNITFDGPSNGHMFSVSGSAQGIALVLLDTDGNLILPGTTYNQQNIKPGENILNYQVQLVANNSTLHAGEYHTLLRFKLDYH